MSETELSRAIDTLVRALEEDKEPGSYYFGWQSNIAMAFYDEYRRRKPQNLHEIAEVSNEAAKNFLNLLCHVNKKD